MQVHEDARIERLYCEIRTLTAMRLQAVAVADWAWVDVLEWKRGACRDELSSACAAAMEGHQGHLLSAA
ncbi:MAG: hypothetical protein O7H40_15425 [Gammaproteobacteria bacterium]|nr:hypothetical protein [Gammaproteobacteria bacterium]